MFLPGIKALSMSSDKVPCKCYVGAYYEEGYSHGDIDDLAPQSESQNAENELRQSSSTQSEVLGIPANAANERQEQFVSSAEMRTTSAKVRFEDLSGQCPDEDATPSRGSSNSASWRIGKRYHLVLKLEFDRAWKSFHGPQLLQEALNIVVQKWSYAFSVLQSNPNLSKSIREAREKFYETMDVLDISILTESESINKCTLRELEWLGEEFDVPLERHPQYGDVNIGQALNSEGLFIDIGVLLSVIILRNGNASEMGADYMETFGVPTRPLSATPGEENKFGLDMDALERNVDIFHSHWIAVLKNLWYPTNMFSPPTPIIWTHQNLYLAVLVCAGRTRVWATVVCCTILPEQQEPNEQSQDRQLQRRDTSSLRKARKKKCIFKFLNLLDCARTALSYANRGVYKIETILLSTEHLELDPFKLGSQEPLRVQDKNTSEFLDIIRTYLIEVTHSDHVPRFGISLVRLYKKFIRSAKNSVLGNSRVGVMALNLSEIAADEARRQDPPVFQDTFEGRNLMRRIVEANGHIKQIKYHVDGGKLRLNSGKTLLWRLYVVGSAILSILAGVFNIANRDNWYERLFDSVQAITFLWIGVFGLLKLTSEDTNIIRHTIFGRQVIRDEDDLRNIVDPHICKLALINSTQPTIDWLSSDGLCFAIPQCTGGVKLLGGIRASDAIKEGLVVTDNVAVFVKRGRAFRVRVFSDAHAHIEKNDELTEKELAEFLSSDFRVHTDRTISGISDTPEWCLCKTGEKITPGYECLNQC